MLLPQSELKGSQVKDYVQRDFRGFAIACLCMSCNALFPDRSLQAPSAKHLSHKPFQGFVKSCSGTPIGAL